MALSNCVVLTLKASRIGAVVTIAILRIDALLVLLPLLTSRRLLLLLVLSPHAAYGGMRRQDQKKKEAAAREQWEQDQQRIYAENRNRYNRAYAACLEGKDYTVR